MSIGAIAGIVGGSNLLSGYLSSRAKRKAIDKQNEIIRQGLNLYNENRGLQKQQLNYQQDRTFAVNSIESYASGIQEDQRLIDFNKSQAQLQTKMFDLETQQGTLGFQTQKKPNAFLEGLSILSGGVSSAASVYSGLKV